jgi:hypothetical protein
MAESEQQRHSRRPQRSWIAHFVGWSVPLENLERSTIYERSRAQPQENPSPFSRIFTVEILLLYWRAWLSTAGQLKSACGQSVAAVIYVEVAHAIASPQWSKARSH